MKKHKMLDSSDLEKKNANHYLKIHRNNKYI